MCLRHMVKTHRRPAGDTQQPTGLLDLIIRVSSFQCTKKEAVRKDDLFFGTPEGTRTPNPRNRNPMLYPLSHRCICIHSQAIITGFSAFVKGECQNFSPTIPLFSPKTVVFCDSL